MSDRETRRDTRQLGSHSSRTSHTAVRALALTVAAFAVCATAGCLKKASPKSEQNAMHSKARGGKVDRFYLATMMTKETFEGTDIPKGSEVIFGVACKGEDEAPDFAAWVPDKLTDASLTTQNPTKVGYGNMPANARTRLHQFVPFIETKITGDNTCEIIFGDAAAPARIIAKPEDFSHGNEAVFVERIFNAGGSCTTTATGWLSVTGVVVAAVASSAVLPGVLTVGIPAVLAPPMIAGAAAATSLCVTGWTSLLRDIGAYKKKEPLALFFDGMREAETLTEARLAGDAQLKGRIDGLVKEKNLRLAAALYNQAFVEEFNKNVTKNLDKNWTLGRALDLKTISSDDFFKAVKSVELSIEEGFKTFESNKAGIQTRKIDDYTMKPASDGSAPAQQPGQ